MPRPASRILAFISLIEGAGGAAGAGAGGGGRGGRGGGRRLRGRARRRRRWAHVPAPAGALRRRGGRRRPRAADRAHPARRRRHRGARGGRDRRRAPLRGRGLDGGVVGLVALKQVRQAVRVRARRRRGVVGGDRLLLLVGAGLLLGLFVRIDDVLEARVVRAVVARHSRGVRKRRYVPPRRLLGYRPQGSSFKRADACRVGYAARALVCARCALLLAARALNSCGRPGDPVDLAACKTLASTRNAHAAV